MADISKEELTTEIQSILKTADLSVISSKKVREQVEKKFKCSLLNRKKEFDKILMDCINSQQEEEDGGESEEENNKDGSGGEDEDEEVSSEEEKKPAKKRPQPTERKSLPPKKKRKTLNASDSGTESDGNNDSDFEISKKKKKAAGPKKKKAAGAGGARKSTGFTRAYNLSPELSTLMGTESSPRHEVVKKVWAIIKERNLYDPKNKQYAICDDELLKVMKVKRFRTFGMLKHLKPHFLD